MYCTSLSPCQWKKKKSERDALILNIQSALLCVVCLEFQRRMSLPQCVCVCVSRQERRRQTRNPFLFLLVKTFHPSICQGEAKGDYYWESKLLACLRVVFRVWWHCPPLSSLTVYFLCVLSIETISPPHLNTKRIPLKEGKQRKTTTKGWPASVTYFGRACRLNPPPKEYQKLYGNIKTHNKLWVRRKPNPSPKKREILSIFSIRQVKILAKAILIGLKTFSLDPIDKFQWKY